jgi:hypothetical protein
MAVDRLFSPEQLDELAVSYPDRIIQYINSGKMEEALSACSEMRESRILLHDFFADSCTVLWSFIGERLGEDVINDMFRYIFKQSAERQYYNVAEAQVMPHLTVYLLAKSWRAHSCFGAGEYPGKFSITEDDEKFTFHLNPCGSGARLWQKGWYEKGRRGRLSEKAYPWSYSRIGFPYYCIHCPFLNEILPYESGYGKIMWPVDPLKDPEGECAWHVYKNPDRISEKYYKRLNLTRKPGNMRLASAKKGKYFSDFELEELARPMTDRIAEMIKQGDLRKARRLCRDVKDEFLPLHDLYIMMLLATFTFIADRAGETALSEALDIQFDKCIKGQILLKTKNKTAREKVIFLATKIFGTDNCNGSGYYRGAFSIEETEKEIRFILNPCGSGGRLLRSGCYDRMGSFQKYREKAENSIVNFLARHIPLPESVLKIVFPWVVTHFTQRKSYSQGITKEAYSWSFWKKGTPYYCCQCGKIAEKLIGTGLQIESPKSKTDVCVWKIDKVRLSNS